MANPKWPSNPPPPKRSWPNVGTSCCSSVPKNFLSSGSVGGSRWVALGSTLACFLLVLFVGGPLSEHGPLHVLAGGGGVGDHGGGRCSP